MLFRSNYMHFYTYTILCNYNVYARVRTRKVNVEGNNIATLCPLSKRAGFEAIRGIAEDVRCTLRSHLEIALAAAQPHLATRGSGLLTASRNVMHELLHARHELAGRVLSSMWQTPYTG